MILSMNTMLFADAHYGDEWQIILNECVDDRGLNKEALVEDEVLLHTFLNSCAQVDFAYFLTWERSAQLSFLINFYNAAALALFLKMNLLMIIDYLKLIVVQRFSTCLIKK